MKQSGVQVLMAICLLVALCCPALVVAAPPATPPAAPAPAPTEPATTEPAPTSESDDLFQATETPEGIDSSTRESEIYGARIDGMQADVDDLKERIFRSKARLSVLKETVLHGVLAGSRVIIVHRNLMGSQFRLTKLAVILDGAQIYARTDESGALDQEDELTVLDGNIVPGPHTLTVELTYQGQGFGVFSYLNGYTFESRSSHNFTAPENGALRLISVGYEKGNLSTEMKDRPSVDWQEIALDASGKPLPQVKSKSSKSKSSKSNRNKKSSTKKAADAKLSDEPASEPDAPSDPETPSDEPSDASPASAEERGMPKLGGDSASKPAAQKPTPQKPGAKPAAKPEGK